VPRSFNSRPAIISCIGDHTERVLVSIGKSPEPIIARAKGEEGMHLLTEATNAARRLGIFGAPTFAVSAEIFWGDDRLEEAVNFAVRS
jgi:2-hydroxychromene-2-carboxylate isomerase